MKTLRAHGFNQRPRFEQVVGYLERNEPLPLDQPDRKATSFVTSHFYLDDFVQSSEDPNPRPLQHTPLHSGGGGPHRRRSSGARSRAGLPLSAAPGRGRVRAPERAAPSGPAAAASANNATLATVAANYGLKTVVDQHSLDIAARITPLEVDTKVANALLNVVSAAARASELASRDASISGLQASKADASGLTAYALQSAVDTSSEVDSKIAAALLDAVTTAALDAALVGKADASALAALLSTVDGLDTPLEVDTKIVLGLATEAFVAAQLASRDASISALQGAKADTTLLASYAERRALRQQDHAPERPRRNPCGARRPAASRRRSC